MEDLYRRWDRSREINVHLDQADLVNQIVIEEKGVGISFLRFSLTEKPVQPPMRRLPLYLSIVESRVSFVAPWKYEAKERLVSSPAASLTDSALAPHIQIWAYPFGLLLPQHHHHQVPQWPSSCLGPVTMGGVVNGRVTWMKMIEGPLLNVQVPWGLLL